MGRRQGARNALLRAVENINPTENAISAVTKILQFNGSQVNLDQVLPMW